MKKIFLILGILLLISQSSFALYHDFVAGEKQKELAYLLMPQSSGSTMGSALNYDIGLGGNRSGEISLFSSRTATLLPNDSAVQLQLLGKQKLWDLGPIGITGALGVGMVYSPALGSAFSPNVGIILGSGISPELQIGAPFILSIYSDPAILLDYSLGVSYSPALLGKKNLLAGIKGTMMGLFNSSQMAFSSSMYAYFGLRVEL